MSRWARQLLLIAGGLGGLGFFLPFFVVQLDERAGVLEVSGYRLTVGFDDEALNAVLYVQSDELVYGQDPESAPEPGKTRSLVPFYFVGPAVMLVVALLSLLRGRVGRLAFLTLAAGVVAFGGWVREQHYEFVDESSHASVGAVLLAASGVIAVLASLATLIWREPGVDRVSADARRLPPARVLDRK